MNGTMWFDSEEGKGSIFYFTIQAPIGQDSEQMLKSASPQRSSLVALIHNSDRSASVLM